MGTGWLAVVLLAVAHATAAAPRQWPQFRTRPRSTAGRAVHAARARPGPLPGAAGAAAAEGAANDRVLQNGVPVGLPRRFDRAPRPDGGVVSILDYNASTDGTHDVSAIIFQVATAHPPRPPNGPAGSGGSRTLLFPPGVYLIDPPKNVTSGGSVYCELQYKCPFIFEFSIGNAEIMENCP